jgi:hypothetical protein
MALVTLSDWVEATRRHLTSGRQNERNVLNASYTAGSGTITLVNALGGIVPGARISIGLNVLYVTAVTPTGSAASVIGGQEGSVDANASSGALVRVNPTVTDFDIAEALSADLADLSSPGNGLWQMVGVTLPAPYDASLAGVDLSGYTTNFIDVYDVRYRYGLDTTNWVSLDQFLWRLDRSSDVTGFPSGYGVLITPGFVPPGSSLHVVLRTGFTPLSALTDPIANTGLQPTAYDLPPIGAAMRLMMPREAARNETKTQGDTRRAGEVPAGAVLNSARGLAAWRAQRLQAESDRLVAIWPQKRW